MFLLFIGSFGYAQDTQYNYKIKLFGVTDLASANGVRELMQDVFRTNTVFNDSSQCFEFTSRMCVNETGFEYLMADESYKVLLFCKDEIVAKKED